MHDDPGSPADAATGAGAGLQALVVEHRARLIRFLRARGAGDDAEDIVQDLWQRVARPAGGPIADAASYLFRAADNLMRDRHRERVARARREGEWGERHDEAHGGPDGEHLLLARERLARAEAALAALGPRADMAFRRFRLDGVGQAAIARELGVSLSTVEKDLQKAYHALGELQQVFDAE